MLPNHAINFRSTEISLKGKNINSFLGTFVEMKQQIPMIVFVGSCSNDDLIALNSENKIVTNVAKVGDSSE